jgi:replication factor A1
MAATALSGAGGAGGMGGRPDKRCSIAAIRDEDLGRSGKPDWVTVKRGT